MNASPGGAPLRVLVVTNMWPTNDAPQRGVFVQEQVEALRQAAPEGAFDVLHFDGRRGRLEYPRAALRLRGRLRGGYDLVHAHYGLTGAVGLAQRRVPLVVTFHGSDVHVPWQRRVSRAVARRAERRVFVSERLRRRADVEGDVIPSGTDLDLFRPLDRQEARRRLGLDGDRPVVLFPGAPSNPVKDHALFGAALAALPPPWRERVVPLALEGVQRAMVPSYVNAADVVLVTSRYEGSQMVAREALACEVPVVSVDVADMKGLLEGLALCRVTDREPEALARAAADAMAGGGRTRGRERLRTLGLDAPAVARRLLDLYRETVGRRG